MADARSLHAVWYGGKPPPGSWRVAASLFGALSAARRALYRVGALRATRLPVPVLVVGNITAGGTGKTPLAIALAQALRARGFKPGIISRGHGGAARDAVRVDESASPARVGDEACLMHDRAGVPVAVARRRADAGQLLLRETDVDVLIADDGMQHYALARDIEIAVVDGQRRAGNGRLLPAGPLREPLARLAGVDFIVCNGGIAETGEVAMRLQVEDAQSLSDARTRPLRDFADQRVHAVAGIGNPQRFFDALRAAGIEIVEHPFADHHDFTPADLDFGAACAVLMTQKDAVKCKRFARPDWWSVPVTAQLPAQFIDSILARIAAARERLASHGSP